MPRAYTFEEYADMLHVYGFTDGNGDAAVREYSIRFPNRPTPNRRTFEKVHQRLQETGNVGLRKGERPAVNHGVVFGEIENDPRTSCRKISLHTGLSKPTVHRNLKANNYHPYHHTKIQNILPPDHAMRLQFCRQYLLINHANISVFIL